MPQIQGIKDEAVVVYCEPLITKEDIISFRSIRVIRIRNYAVRAEDSHQNT